MKTLTVKRKQPDGTEAVEQVVVDDIADILMRWTVKGVIVNRDVAILYEEIVRLTHVNADLRGDLAVLKAVKPSTYNPKQDKGV